MVRARFAARRLEQRSTRVDPTSNNRRPKLETGNWNMTMFIHSVYFWLKPDLTEAERAAFWAGVNSLTTIKSVRQGYVGAPAATDRPIIDRSYSCALVIICDDEA